MLHDCYSVLGNCGTPAAERGGFRDAAGAGGEWEGSLFREGVLQVGKDPRFMQEVEIGVPEMAVLRR